MTLEIGKEYKAEDIPFGGIVNMDKCACTHRRVPIPFEFIAKDLAAGHLYDQALRSKSYPWFKIVSKCKQANCAFSNAKRGRVGWCFDDVKYVKEPTKGEQRNNDWVEHWRETKNANATNLDVPDVLKKLVELSKVYEDAEKKAISLMKEVADLHRAGLVTQGQLYEVAFEKHLLHGALRYTVYDLLGDEFMDSMKK